jgi:hypothetical protein
MPCGSKAPPSSLWAKQVKGRRMFWNIASINRPLFLAARVVPMQSQAFPDD